VLAFNARWDVTRNISSAVSALVYANGTTDFFELCINVSLPSPPGAGWSLAGDESLTWFCGHFLTTHTP